MNDAATHPWAFGSRKVDFLLFISILLLMIVLAPRLRVYYSVTVYDISITEIQPDGTRKELPAPAELKRLGNGYWKGESLVKRLSPRISEYMQQSDWPTAAPAGTRYEWDLRWSDESTTLDHADRIVWEAGK